MQASLGEKDSRGKGYVESTKFRDVINGCRNKELRQKLYPVTI
jgi:hypothetical protein